MTRGIAAALLTALLGFSAASGTASPTFTSGPRVTQAVLANGLRVVVVENHALPLAEISMWYRFGSVDDPPGRTGLAHALEHMMFRGTRALPGSALDLATARFGIDANAETDFESTHYYQIVPADSVPLALHIEADRMRGLLLRPSDWNLERGAVLAELAASASGDVDALEDAVRHAAYGVSPFAHGPIGTTRDVMRTGVGDLRRAYDAGYQPDNATLVVTGDVDPADISRLAEQIFGPIRGHARVRHPRAEPLAVRGFTVQRTSQDEDIVDVALESHGMLGPGGAAEEVADELIQPEHAALSELLVDSGPCSSYDVDEDLQLYGGLIHLVCHVDEQVKPPDALAAIRRALRRLAEHVTASAIESARRADVAASVYARDSLRSEASLYGQAIAIQHTDPRQFDVDAERVPAAAVAAVLRRWASPVGAGISTGATSRSSMREPAARTSRSEHVAGQAAHDVVSGPAWANEPVKALAAPASATVDAFGLRNGLRLFIAPRRGNGTVYLRGGFDDRTTPGRSTVWPRRRVVRVADQHAMVVELGIETKMHGFTRDLPLMLEILADSWRAPPRSFPGLRLERERPRPEHAWIAITGDVDSTALLAIVTRSFGAWRPPPALPTAESSPPPSLLARAASKSKFVAYNPSAPGARAFTVRIVPARTDPDSPAMALLNSILGDDSDPDTRLVSDVRTRRGLAYGVGSSYNAEDGQLFVWWNSTRRNFPAARAATRTVVDALLTGPISPAELARARRKLLAKALRRQSSPEGVLDALAVAATDRRAPDDLDSLAARYDAVTREDLERVARTRVPREPSFELNEGRPF